MVPLPFAPDGMLCFLSSACPRTLLRRALLRVRCEGRALQSSTYQTEDAPRIAWRGRWRKVETLEHYLQEVAAQLLLTDLPPAARATIGEFETAGPRLLELFLRLGSASLWGEMERAPGVKPRYCRDLKAVSRKQGF